MRIDHGRHDGIPTSFHVLAGAPNDWMAECVLAAIETEISQ
jgi:hypothetical protein